MANEGIHMPGGMGGLMRYDEEYPSKFMLKPGHVIGLIIGIIVLSVVLHLFFPVS